MADNASRRVRDQLLAFLDALKRELAGYKARLAAVKAGNQDPSSRVFGSYDPQFAIGESELKQRAKDTQGEIDRVTKTLEEIERKLIAELTDSL